MRYLLILILFLGLPVRAQDLPLSQEPGAGLSEPALDCGEGFVATPDLPDTLAGPRLPHCLPPGRLLGPDFPIEPFRALIRRHALAQVAAVLKAAWAEDLAEGKMFPRSRGLVFAFADLDPATDSLTRDWLAQAPGDAFAQTARAQHLLSRGWAWRGGDVLGRTWPDRLERMQALHAEADALFRKALAQKPDFLPAAEGLISLDLARGDTQDAILTFNAAMMAHPNLVTLRSAMPMLAPQWGGTEAMADLFCNRYAPMVDADPPYDAATCKIDAAFTAPYNGGPRMIAAQKALHDNPNPWLNNASALLATAPWEDPAWRLKVLTRVHGKRAFTPDEALAWDQLNAARGANLPPEYPAAITRALAAQRQAADNAPEDPRTLTDLVGLMARDAEVNHTPMPQADILARAQRVLRAFPQDPGIWLMAAQALLVPDPNAARNRLSQVVAAEPYFINAIVYSGYQESTVTQALDTKLRILDLNAASNPDLPPLTQDYLDQVLLCPTIRQYAILQLVCQANGRAGNGCGAWEAETAQPDTWTDAMMKDRCLAERHPESQADLAYTPIPIQSVLPPS